MKYLLSSFIALLFISCNFSEKKNKNNALNTTEAIQIQDPILKESMERGEQVYVDFCMQCHMENGKGVSGSFPPLAYSNWLTEKRTESIYAIKFGQQGEIIVNEETYNGIMAPLGLTDEEIADVMNYIMNTWGNTQEKMVTTQEVSKVLKH